MAWTLLAEFRSDSNPSKFYRVALNERGELGCSCPAWCTKSVKKPCKHIRRLTTDDFNMGDAKLTTAGADWVLKRAINAG